MAFIFKPNCKKLIVSFKAKHRGKDIGGEMSIVKTARHLVGIDVEKIQSTMALFIKNHTSPEQLLRQLEGLYSSGQVQEAQHFASGIIDTYHPLIQEADFFVLHSKILFETLGGDHHETQAALKQALILDPNHRAALTLLKTYQAQQDLRDGLYAQGEATLREMVQTDTLNAYAAYILAHHLLWKNGPEADAIRFFEHTLQLRPRFLRAHVGLGMAYKKARDLAKADAAFADCLGLDSNFQNHEFYKRHLQNL